MSEYNPANAEIRPDTVYPCGSHNLPTREVVKGMFAGRVGVCPYCPTTGGSAPAGQALYWLPGRRAYFATATCGNPSCVRQVPIQHMDEGPAWPNIPENPQLANAQLIARSMTRDQAMRVLDEADERKKPFPASIESILVEIVAGMGAVEPTPPPPPASPFHSVTSPSAGSEYVR